MLARLLSVAAVAAALSSSFLVSAQAPTAGLVHYMKLDGNYNDQVVGATPSTLQGNPLCASFAAVSPVAAAFNQSCGASPPGSLVPATIADSDPLESSDLSMCVEVYLPSVPTDVATIFSCNGFQVGNVDCIRLAYYGPGGNLIAQLNKAGGGDGPQVPGGLPLRQWFSLCVTYNAASQKLLSYVNGAVVNNFTIAHTQSSYAAPVLAGDGNDDNSQPTLAAFLNWRVYVATLTPAQVNAIVVADLPSGHVTGDPQFVGLRGQSFQVHGIDGAVYNLISEPTTQVNSRFVFLEDGQCPIINGIPADNCWSHPGSYIGELSFQQVVDGKVHAMLVTSGAAKRGFAAVQMDGRALKVGDKAVFGSFAIEYKTAYSVAVSTEHFEFLLDNSDLFINQAMRSKIPLSKLTSHGLLGQTHSSKTYKGAIPHIEGRVDDYSIVDGDLFGTDFIYNQFQA